MSVRPLVAAGLLVLALSGCEKPTPGVTVAAGSSSVHIESTTYCHEGQSPEKQNCAEHLDRLGVVKVKPGQQVIIDVDNDIAENGWILVDTDASARSNVQDEHFFSYTPDFQRGPVVHLEIRSLDRPADDAATTGIWKFQLIQQ
jgi:hypothetical protein